MDWPVVAAGADHDEPVAIITRERVMACSKEARRRGVKRGMRVRQASGRCPQLKLLDRDPEGEVRGFEPVLRLLEKRIAPHMEVLRPGLVALPARGPARYFGGESALAEQITTVLTEAGIEARTGAADSVFAAALAVRAPQAGQLVPVGRTAAFLAPYPVGVLGRPRLSQLLPRLGITTLGAFAALHGERVLARFGQDAAAAQRTAQGLEARPLNVSGAEPDYSVTRAFEPAEDNLEPVAFIAKALAEQLHAGLARASAVAARLQVEVALANGLRLSRLWRHEGRLSALAVAERVRWQIAAWAETGQLDTAAAGITALRLVPEGLSAATGRQPLLFGPRIAPQELEHTAGQLQAMLGHRAVVRQELAGGRGPGERVVAIPYGDARSRPWVEGTWPGRLPAPHPAVVYPTPRPADLLAADGSPVSVSGRALLSRPPAALSVDGAGPVAVTGWSGPWPVLEDWWIPARARRLARLQVVCADGRAWLLHIRDGRWAVEALYG
ncbi:DNA polymerase Y family protein [Streptomyces sp. SID13726]|nr:DNA polymerase Y family protein [Streptomyces sp. SID13726]NEB01930.1 DNA polymerase Y family protein [Streptomyces sp. SID13726]